MKIHNHPVSYSELMNPVITIGTFDGVHRGHLSVIHRLAEIASQVNGETVVITFNPHPRQVLSDDHQFKVLSTFSEKTELLSNAGVNHMVILPFTGEFAALSFAEFVSSILVDKMHAKAIVIGYDHHFGNQREGNFEKLNPLAAQYGVNLYRVDPEEIGNTVISSTKIRNALLSGKISEANKWLGYEYSVSGSVIVGNMIGRNIGYPTANIQPDDNAKLIPARGVYAATVCHEGQEYIGMLNIGIRPTIENQKETIEVHILNFNGDIYGHDLKIVFHEFIREEKKFRNLEELKAAIDNDRLAIMKIFDEKRG